LSRRASVFASNRRRLRRDAVAFVVPFVSVYTSTRSRLLIEDLVLSALNDASLFFYKDFTFFTLTDAYFIRFDPHPLPVGLLTFREHLSLLFAKRRRFAVTRKKVNREKEKDQDSNNR
jgi:hypothetical protein